MKRKISSIDEYISVFPLKTQVQLQKIRKTIHDTAPDAEEKISYAMPAFSLNGMLVYFAGYENHLGFYPTASGIKNFQKEISKYKNSKGAIQFPVDKPIPVGLIKKIVKFRVKENLAKQTLKKKLVICDNGHRFYKSSDCPVCPICEKLRKPKEGFLSQLSAPARRALENLKIYSLKDLSKLSETELLKLHGFGKASIPVLRKALKDDGLSFR
jgi:uncharacterized protein YdhG (YjbR/CyaY superfamily)